MSNDLSNSSTFEGHRERLRARFLAGEEASLTDVALLDLLLSFAIPRRDVKPLAEALLARFGNLSSVLSAPPSDLKKVAGIKESSVTLLKLAGHLRAAPDSTPVADEAPPEEPPIAPEPAEPPAPEMTSTVVPEKAPAPPKEDAPKLQVTNGYLFDPAQLAQVLSFADQHPELRKISRKQLQDGTGLADRQLESLASIGAAMGLVAPRTTVLTAFGKLVATHDLFLDSLVTLEFCHYLGAANSRNLIWFMVFNDLLVTQKPSDQAGWSAWLREQLEGKYSPRSLVKHVAHEVRFLLDAYTVNNFKKLNLIYETPEKTFTLRRYSALQPLTLAAMIYLVGQQHQARLVAFSDLHAVPGSPGRVFGIDATTLRQMIEHLHQKGWLRFEVRHGLDQIRLQEGFTPLEFLSAAYENRPPMPGVSSDQPEEERLLL